jgi:rubredoxin
MQAHGHKYDVVTKEATCTEAGEKKYTCTVCGHSYTETIPATDHSYPSEVSYTADPKNTNTTSLTAYKNTTYGNCTKCGDANHPADTQEEIGSVTITPNETTWGQTKAQLDNVHLTYWFRKAGTTESVSNVQADWTVAEIYYNFNSEGKGSVIVYVNVPEGDSGASNP